VIYGSVCSGIEAATVAWAPLRWQPAWFAEIDPFACAVLAHRFPEVLNLGDFTSIRGHWLRRIGAAPIDLLVGGTPCVAFSVAGKRRGLDDPRGNLTLEFLRLAQRLRPRWLVWENVPGVLSIDGGRTFGTVLGTLVELGYGVAYRILDAQFFGVPQRRRRVFVVGRLGRWQAAAAVLFERESLRRDLAPRRKARQGVAALTAHGVGTCGGDDTQAQSGHLIPFGGNNTSGPIEVATACNAHGGAGRMDFETETICVEIAPPLLAGANRTGGDRFPGMSADTCEALVAHTLRGEGMDASEDGTGRGIPLLPVGFSCKDSGADAVEDMAPTLRAMGHADSHPNAGGQVAVAFRGFGQDGFVPREIAPPVLASDGGTVGPPVVFESRFARNGRGAPDVIAPPLKAQSGATGRGDGAPLVMTGYASTDKANTASLLRELRAAVGEKAYAEWRSRILASFQQTEVLRQDVLCGIPGAGETAHARSELDDCPLSCPESLPAGSLRDLWEAGQDRRSPHRRELAEQLAGESGAALPELPHQDPSIYGRLTYVSVRRLTPRECERLMGLPDDHTLISNYRQKLRADEVEELGAYLGIPLEEARRLGATPDGPRYKAIGNSMAVPVMRWIGERIDHVDHVLQEVTA
jgi:DNA (cytosine-5)-methyltransferase 1